MAEAFEFYTEKDPSLRVRVSGKGDTIIFRGGFYATNDPHEILTLTRHPDVISPKNVKVDLREPVVSEPVEEEVLSIMGNCEAVTATGEKCKIPVIKDGEKLCHVHARMAEKEAMG